MRVSAAILAAAVLTLLSGAARAESLPPQLKVGTMIEGDVIRLGDIWDNAGDKAATAVASAPQPGRRVTLDARWLAAVAAAHHLDWRPATLFDKTMVERAAQTVDTASIETELREALALEGAPAGSQIEIANRNALHVVVPVGTPATIGVRDVMWDPRMNRFSATVEIPAGSVAATRVKVAGRLYATTRIPVLTHTINRGDVISERDIQWVDVRDDQVRRDIAVDARQLVGLEPRFPLRANTPVRLNDVQRPVAVSKGQSVTMVMKNRFMTLTAQGRAIEDGGVGDVIRLTNVQTKQTVEGRVDGPGMVTVTPGGTRALAN